jgi:hypothetical protein
VNSYSTALIVFACMLGGALAGMWLRTRVPEQHLSDAAKDVIRLGMGLIATMTALVLGLVIATAKSAYDQQDDAVKRSAAKVLLLDHMLANYGPETKDVRQLLRSVLIQRVDEIWPEGRAAHSQIAPANAPFRGEEVEARLLQLTPRDEVQSWLRSQALSIFSDIAETRWLAMGGLHSAVPALFVVVVVFWLTIIFASFGLFAPRNGTVMVALFLCALSVGGSIFLILELNHPFSGVMKVSSAPLRYALQQLGP